MESLTPTFLKVETPKAWIDAVMRDFNSFLIDHAAAEKKASGMAMSMLSHYPDKPLLIKKMTDLAIEEMCHFREVSELIYERGLQLGSDEKDLYVNEFRKVIGKGTQVYLLDRLIIGAIIEARGAERFGIVAESLEPGTLKKFYTALSRSEERHYEMFLSLAYEYGDKTWIDKRVNELLDFEAKLILSLPIQAKLH